MSGETAIIPEGVRGRIDRRLDEIERVHSVRILFAIESGSRAWGFSSPDSDYDVRFVYVHDPAWYLSIDTRRDVIELPIDADLDINGWDLQKALRLLIKPNPVLLEWLRSPVVYRAEETAMNRIRAFGERVERVRPSAYHYLHIAEGKYRQFIDGRTAVPCKTYLYCLRPILALKWMRARPGQPVPMTWSELRAGADLSSEISLCLDDLMVRKAASNERAEGPRVPVLDAFIESEINAAQSEPRPTAPQDRTLLDEANALFRDIAGRGLFI